MTSSLFLKSKAHGQTSKNVGVGAWRHVTKIVSPWKSVLKYVVRLSSKGLTKGRPRFCHCILLEADLFIYFQHRQIFQHLVPKWQLVWLPRICCYPVLVDSHSVSRLYWSSTEISGHSLLRMGTRQRLKTTTTHAVGQNFVRSDAVNHCMCDP